MLDGFEITGALLAFLAGLPIVLERLRRPIGMSDRQGTDGTFAQLPQGLTHYRWVGPSRGPVAVVIHGIHTPCVAVEDLADGLGSLGYRVLVYDLYGRGLSDAPKGVHDQQFFMRQLTDLLADQRIEGDLTLVGYSMGASIATAFAAANPHRVARLIMIAGAGVIVNEDRFEWFCRRVPVLGDWLHGVATAPRLRKRATRRHEPPDISRVLMAQRQELGRRGYLPAILSSRRNLLMHGQKQDHVKLGRDAVPVIALWADKDEVIPFGASAVLVQWNRAVRQGVVAGAGHGLPYTHCVKVIDTLRGLLREQ